MRCRLSRRSLLEVYRSWLNFPRSLQKCIGALLFSRAVVDHTRSLGQILRSKSRRPMRVSFVWNFLTLYLPCSGSVFFFLLLFRLFFLSQVRFSLICLFDGNICGANEAIFNIGFGFFEVSLTL